MKKRLWYLILSFCTLSASQFAQAQTRCYPNTLLWRITGNNLQKPSYLFGTMHLDDRRLFQFGDSLYMCLERAEGYAMEINPDSAMIAMFKAINEPDTSALLKNVLSKTDLERISKPIQKKYGISPDKITRKQVWIYSHNRFKIKKSDDMETAVDTYLYNIAKKQGKWVGGIEDIEDHFNLIEEIGAGFDGQGHSGNGRQKKMLDRMMAVYLAQDLNAINDWSNSIDDDTKEDMLTRRNIKMVYRMDSMARIRSNFFAVGAAHLPGKDGLIELLEQKGFTVEPIFSSKKIVPEEYTYKTIELAWHKVEDKDKTFTVEMPGKPYPLEGEGVMTMQTYADMGSGLIFLATSIKSNRKIVSPDSMLAHMAKNISGNKQISNKKTIDLNGVPGIEAFTSNESHFYRLRGFVKGRTIFLLVTAASKKEMLDNKETNRFFQSLVMHQASDETASKDRAWKLTTMEKHGLQIEMPGTPKRDKQLEETFTSNSAANWNVHCYTVSDKKADIFYMLFVRVTKPGFHVLNDTSLFAESKRNSENSFADSVSLYELFDFDGYPAMRMNANHKENDYEMQSLHVNRGDRCYTLIAIGNENNDNKKDFSKYLNSFKLMTYQKVQWHEQASPDKVFRSWVPSSIATLPADDSETVADPGKLGTLLAYDSVSGYSFAVHKELISPYYWAHSDSAFFQNYASQYIGLEDSITEKRPVQNGAIEGMEYFVRSPVISNIKRLRLLPYRDTLFVVFSMIPTADIRQVDHDKYFTEFRFNNDVAVHNYRKNKTSKLLADLFSKDSVTFHKASTSIQNAPFTVEDLPSLHNAMLHPYQDFDESIECTHDKILSAVAGIKHPSTVEFIQSNYHQLTGEKEKLKYPLLSVLARTYTSESYKLFSTLARERTPSVGNARTLQYYLRDSLSLTASLFPDILQLTTDSIFIAMFPAVLCDLLDSSLIRINVLAPYANNFYKYAQRELVRLNDADEYGYLATSLIKLLGKFNTGESNQLLQRFLKARQINVKENAAVALLKNNQVVDRIQLEKIAADRDYRCDLYSQLVEAGKEKFFPPRYSSQKSIAESNIYIIASDDYEPSAVQFIGERMAEYKGEKQKFFLFRITYKYDDGDSGTYLGITGPYVGTKKVVINSEVTGLYLDEPFDTKKVDQHLKLYLEQQEKNLKGNIAQ